MTAPSPAQTPEEVALRIVGRWSPCPPSKSPLAGHLYRSELCRHIADELRAAAQAERERIVLELRTFADGCEPGDTADAVLRTLAARLEAGLSPAPEGKP